MMTPNPLLGYAQQQLPARHGCESHHSVVADENHAIFFDRDGVVSFNGQQTENVSDRKIRNLYSDIARDPENYLHRVAGIHDNQPDRPRIRWLISTDSAGVGGRQLVLDRRTGAWHIEHYDQDRDQRCAWSVPELGKSVVYTGDGRGRIWRIRYDESLNELYSDEGRGIRFKWYSRWFGDGITEGLVPRVDIILERSATGQGQGDLTVLFWADGESAAYHSARIPLWAKGAERPELYSGHYENSSDPLTVTVALDLPARFLKFFRVGFEYGAANGDVRILRGVVYPKPVGRRQAGVA